MVSLTKFNHVAYIFLYMFYFLYTKSELFILTTRFLRTFFLFKNMHFPITEQNAKELNKTSYVL